MIPGEMIEVLPHCIKGYEWTIGHIGSVIGPAHTSLVNKDWGVAPPIWPHMWVVQIENPRAEGGYAYASLPEKHLAPHTCTVESCTNHFGIERT